MSAAVDAWKSIPFAARRKLLDSLAKPSVNFAIAAIIDNPPFSKEIGPELTHIEEHALATALAILEEVDVG